jgi:ethanolamine ammonia-lyase small subunit
LPERREHPSAGEIIPPWLLSWKQATPARILVGRSGQAYTTQTHLTLKADHAFARDAVHAEVDLVRDLGQDLIDRLGIFEVQTQASSKEDYLIRPDKGRLLSAQAKQTIVQNSPREPELQVVLGDGLSASAVSAQIPQLLPMLMDGAHRLGIRLGRTFLVRYCRVGVMNDIGELLDPEVVVLLIGERPGMITAESLSAYFAYRPRVGHNDAHRNLISNIHSRGVSIVDASRRILSMVQQLRAKRLSGVEVKEELDRVLTVAKTADTLTPPSS